MLRLAFLDRDTAGHGRRLRGGTEDRDYSDQDKQRINQRFDDRAALIFQVRSNDQVVGVSTMRFHSRVRSNAPRVPTGPACL